MIGPDSNIGPFKIQSLLGKGGMGEVYSAVDTRLNRSVALKVLPAEFSADADRLRRFQLEARALATLNHPNVALVFGFEEHSAKNLLVLELIEGETLADRLKRGPLPLEEALHVALQVASGLETAHEKGIIHRDLKPANIKITPEDRAKILDFGLAKLATPDPSSSATVLSDSPTILAGSTLPGLILGTAAYMSPEQAKGKTVDKRTDIWSFGCVLYECLTAKRAFDGESITECIGAILHKEPDWSALPRNTSTQLQVLLRRCLSRERTERLHDIADARLELDSLLSASGETLSAPPSPPPPGTRALAATLLSGLLLGAFATLLFVGRRQTPVQSTVPPRQSLIRVPGILRSPAASFKISPDGLRLAYISDDRVYIRKLTDPESSARAIALSDHAMALFWSPDSQWLGFSVDKKLFRVQVEETQPQPITDAPDALGPSGGAAWLGGNKIVFSAGTATNGLLQVLATGGIPRPFLSQNPAIDNDFHDPSPLPDGKTVLFIVHRATNGASGPIDTLAVSSGGTRKTIYTHPGGAPIYSPAWAPSGHILFHTRANVWALPFSLARLEVTGDAVLACSQSTHPSISNDGTLIVNSGKDHVPSRVTSVDRTGKTLLPFGLTQFHATFPPRWSSDGKRVLTCGGPNDPGSAGRSSNLWLYNQTNGYQLTFLKEEAALYPAWAPNNSTVAFTTLDTERASLSVGLLHLNGAEPVNIGSGFGATFTSGGESLVYSYFEKSFFSGNYEIRSKSVGAALEATNSFTTLARFTGQRVPMLSVSPGNQFLAYVSNESDYSSSSFNLYITPFPRCDRRWRVNSPRQPYWPVWRKGRDQLFLYFCDYDGFIYETSVVGDPNALSLGQPVRLFQQQTDGLRNLAQDWPPGFDVSADGQQFLIFQRPDGAPRESFLTMIQNFGAVLSEKK